MWDKIWAEQQRFNDQLHTRPSSNDERTAMTKEFVLHMYSELDELLRASGSWKSHRRDQNEPNRRGILEEATDAFKYLVGTLQLWDITPEEFITSFWEKSAVVQQRYTEEWVSQLTWPAVVVDIDNVLADYIGGLLHFLDQRLGYGWCAADRYDLLLKRGTWITAETLGLPPHSWHQLKAEFRNSGRKRLLPVMPGAKEFLQWCQSQGWAIILLTSRPLKEYAGMYTDTLFWLTSNELPFDYLWFSDNKSESIAKHAEVHPHIQFAVDDDPKFIKELGPWGFPVYHLVHDSEMVTPTYPTVHRIVNLAEIMDDFKE